MEPSNTPIEMQLEQIEQLAASGQLEQARRQYKKICRWEPNCLRAWVGLAKVHYQLAALNDCLQAVDKALRVDAHHIQTLLVGSAALLDQGRYDKVLELTGRILCQDPNHLAALLNRTNALLRLGRFVEARLVAEQVLLLDPELPVAHLNFGLAQHGLGHDESALQAFDLALVKRPDYVQALINRASILHALGRYLDSLETSDLILKLQPDSVSGRLNCAAALIGLERLEEALGVLDALLATQAYHPKALINRSTVLLRLERYDEALQTADKILKFQPADSTALFNRIQALLGKKQYNEAFTELKRIEQQRIPIQSGIVSDLRIAGARALIGLKNYPEAIQLVDSVLNVEPDKSDAILVKVEAIRWIQKHEDALICLENGLANQPNHVDLLLAKSAILLFLKQPREALAALKPLGLQSNNFKVQLCRSGILNELGLFEESLAILEELSSFTINSWQFHACLTAALAGLQRFDESQREIVIMEQLGAAQFLMEQAEYIDDSPVDAVKAQHLDARTLYIWFVYKKFERGDWDFEYEKLFELVRRHFNDVLSETGTCPMPPFITLSWPLSPSLLQMNARSLANHIYFNLDQIRNSLKFEYAENKSGRLRIGYISADFRNHATAHLIRSLFGMHDRQRVEIYGYFLCKDDGSEYYRDIKAGCDHFVDLTGLSNAEAACRIHADGIQILVDLMGYTRFCRTEILALRPAPLQVNYLGFPGTMGAKFMDYIVVDPVVLPLEQARFYSEQPAYLPDSYQVNDWNQEIADTGVGRSEQGLPLEAFVFCCFNQIHKLEPVMFEAWMRILRQVPDGVLWLIEENDEINENLRRAAAARGVDGAKLVFAKRLPKNRHLERHRLADLFLDTRIYNAHTTASDALWAGLPVLTCMGEAFPARVAASLLHAVGLPELITHSLEEYEALAVRLAERPAELAALRLKLADQRLRMPLFDTERFARHLERAYQLMWERHARGLPPGPLHVPSLPRAEPANSRSRLPLSPG